MPDYIAGTKMLRCRLRRSIRHHPQEETSAEETMRIPNRGELVRGDPARISSNRANHLAGIAETSERILIAAEYVSKCAPRPFSFPSRHLCSETGNSSAGRVFRVIVGDDNPRGAIITATDCQRSRAFANRSRSARERIMHPAGM
jgi:hypothetical protein